MGKIAPSQRLREELRQFMEDLEGVEDSKGALSELVRRAVGLIVQESLEAEQRDFIGRERYERGEGRGYRSGYTRGHLGTPMWWNGWRRRCMREVFRPGTWRRRSRTSSGTVSCRGAR